MPVAEAQYEPGISEVVEGTNRDTLSPSPDLSKYDFHTPSRKASRGNSLPHIVIPSTELYGSETPSPLSPLTPPDRLSPIEELDDNASIQSYQPAKHAQFETSANRGEAKRRSRPTSCEFDLQASTERKDLSLEDRSELLFSRQHLELIFADKELSARFGTFLRTYRPESVAILGYYLDTIKALRTLKYAEAVVKNLEQIPGLEFTAESKGVTMTWVLEDKADRTLDILVKNDLPAFVAYVYVSIVDLALVERVTGKAETEGNDVAIGLAEVFTISDPSRPDNPLVFASEEFHRMTQYPSNLALGRNCRFLGGPKTDPRAIGRFKSSMEAEREHCEVMLNYRRDGTPFINLIMVVPLRDQNGRVRYYLGAQLDITELVNTCTGLESLQRLIARQSVAPDQRNEDEVKVQLDQMAEFQQLSETFSNQELQSLLGSQERKQLDDHVSHGSDSYEAPRVRHNNSSANLDSSIRLPGSGSAPPLGFYKNYLLVRPHPSLRILFASPDLRVPGILQSPLMEQIGGSPRVRDDLYHALEAGQKVTAKVRWISKSFQDGRARWIHCTPLISANGLIGVWMVILVDDDEETPASAPPAELEFGATKDGQINVPTPTPWEPSKSDRHQWRTGRPQQVGSDHSPSTTDSSHTAFSESAKPSYESIPSALKHTPETVSLPFASSKHRSPSSAGVSTTDLRTPVPVAAAPAVDWEAKAPRPSTGTVPASRTSSNGHQSGQLPDFQPLPLRPGPRIAGTAYSFNSNSERGISANDNHKSFGSIDDGGGTDRPSSQSSHVAAIRSNVQPPDIRWRKPEDQEGSLGKGGRAPVKLPGRSSQEKGERPTLWKTKKSLSPYGFLFDDH